MSFWSTQKIIDNSHVIVGFDEDKVKEASYTLTVGNEAFITSNPKSKLDNVKKLDISDGYCYIPPGQFAYLITNEEVKIPEDCLAFISMKFSTKAAGLVNVSGFHVDPGYSGKLIFAVYNAGVKNIPIRKDMDIFLIWFSDLDQTDEKPKKSKKGFNTIPNSILENSQEAATLKNISDKMVELELKVSQSTFNSSILLGVLIPLDIFILTELSKNYSLADIPTYIWILTLPFLLLLLFHLEIFFFFRKVKNHFIKNL